VLDLDRRDGIDGVANACRSFGFELDQGAPAQRTGGGGVHVFYAHPGGRVKSRTGAGAIAPGVELKADGGYVVVAPSVHPSGEPYRWIKPLDGRLPDPPGWLLELIRKDSSHTPGGGRKTGKPALEAIPKGQRNVTLTSLAGSMRRRGMSREAIEKALLTENQERCVPPLDEGEVSRIARSVARYQPDSNAPGGAGGSDGSTGCPVVPGPADQFFDGRSFVPLRAARAIKSEGTYAFGYDEDRGTGQLMEYSHGVWRVPVLLSKTIQALLGEEVRKARVEEVISALSRDVPWLPWRQWNDHPRLINCANGMLDPVSMELLPHRPEYHSTFQIPVNWNPEARCEEVDRFLVEVLPGDCAETVDMILGYLCIPDITADKLFVLLGPEKAGKTTFFSLLQALIGTRNVAVVSLQDLADNRFALAQLENKLLW